MCKLFCKLFCLLPSNRKVKVKSVIAENDERTREDWMAEEEKKKRKA